MLFYYFYFFYQYTLLCRGMPAETRQFAHVTMCTFQHWCLCFPDSQADIRPQTDGCNGLRYNLTADIIESIFRTYPAGERCCLAEVKAA